MGALSRYMILSLCVWLMLAGVCFGKQVYLKDGGVIDCENFWLRDGQVVVKVNRDIVLDFEPSEIDLKRTFPEAGKKSPQVKRKRHPRAVKPPPAAAPVTEGARSPGSGAAASAVEPVRSVAPAAATAKPNPPPVPAPAPAARETVRPETAAPAPGNPASPPDKAESERRIRQSTQMVAEAIQKKDPELLKKAIEVQNSALQQDKTQVQKAQGRMIKILLFLLVFGILMIASLWVIFDKAGQAGVKSIVPIYNMYILMVVSGKPGWWVILLFIPVVGFVINLLAMLTLAEKFGRGALFAVGLCLLPIFFFPILAFGGSRYQG